MNILDFLEDNSAIVCENNIKDYILKKLGESQTFLNVQFFPKKDFIKKNTFEYDEKTIYYLITKYHYKIDIAKYLIENLYYIDDKDYNADSLNYLKELKRELIDNNLLYFKKYNGFSNVLVLNYPYYEEYEMNIFNKYRTKFYNVDCSFKLDNVYEFVDIEKEGDFVFNKIATLLDEGININQIKIICPNKNYYRVLRRLSIFYNIPINEPTNNSLYNQDITKIFLDNLSQGLDCALESIKDELVEYYNIIVKICNKYSFIEDIDIFKRLVIDEFKKVKVSSDSSNKIELKTIDDIFDDEYVFLMNFNNEWAPIILKDEEYIKDNVKEEVHMLSTKELNSRIKTDYIKKLKRIKNLVISYSLNDLKSNMFPSSLVQELGLNVLQHDKNILESYSYLESSIEFAKLLDDYELYNNVHEELGIYKNSIDLKYKTFDNKWKGIDKEELREYLNNKLTLSYTSLNNYNKCAFRYYISSILKLDSYEETFASFLGSLFHDVLEKCYAKNKDVQEEINYYINSHERELSLKERFFVNKVQEDITYVLSILKKQESFIGLNKTLYEKYIPIKKDRDIKIDFVGFIDKILYKELNNETIVALIDYKTGYVDIDLKLIPYGINMQLPIYLYLISKSNLFINPRFSGFYLQYVLDKDIAYNPRESYDIQRENNLKLLGYSNNSQDILKEFDNSYENSFLIKGMKTKNDGSFSSYAKVLSDDQINQIIDLTEKNIDNAIDNILEGNFNINPKKIGYDNIIGCQYCSFKDLCFKKEEDYVILEEIKDLSFLGGEEDA